MGAERDGEPSQYVELLVERCVADILAGNAQITDCIEKYPALADELAPRLEARLLRELSERVQTRLARENDD